MKIFRHLFRFYINGSIHVSLSCLALFCITQQQLFFSSPFSLALFVFLGTVFAYNFVKYESLIRRRKNAIRKELKAIVGFSMVVFCGLLYYCLQLRFQTQLGGFFIVEIVTSAQQDRYLPLAFLGSKQHAITLTAHSLRQ